MGPLKLGGPSSFLEGFLHDFPPLRVAEPPPAPVKPYRDMHLAVAVIAERQTILGQEDDRRCATADVVPLQVTRTSAEHAPMPVTSQNRCTPRLHGQHLPLPALGPLVGAQ